MDLSSSFPGTGRYVRLGYPESVFGIHQCEPRYTDWLTPESRLNCRFQFYALHICHQITILLSNGIELSYYLTVNAAALTLLAA